MITTKPFDFSIASYERGMKMRRSHISGHIRVSFTIYKITFINFEHETNFTELVMEHTLVYTELSLVKADQMFDQNRLSTTCVYK